MALSKRDAIRVRNWLRKHVTEQGLSDTPEVVSAELSAYAWRGGQNGQSMRVRSWRQLRSQVARFCESNGDVTAGERIRAAQYPIPVGSRPKRQKRCRKVTDSDFTALVEAVKKSGDTELAAALYIAAKLPIRPAEMPKLSVRQREDGAWVLFKPSAKKRHDRGVDHEFLLQERDMGLVRAISILNRKPMRPIQERLRRLSLKIFPERKHPITFASFRHQNSSDMKEAGVPPEIQAILMGHLSVASQQVYGNSRSGRGRDLEDFFGVPEGTAPVSREGNYPPVGSRAKSPSPR